ncbi:MAG TPA: SDR family oxidoreductase [Afifellaceae bacterium]|nr:SDR family oxidoreductase [Afifellaceae bacterium]
MTTDGKIALVTGASSGIGRHTAQAFLRAGYAVVVTGRRAAELDRTIVEAGVDDEMALVVPCDVSDPVAVDDLFAATEKRFGRLDVIFNNAGTGAPPLPIGDLTFKQWKTVIDVNLTGVFLTARGAFNLMRKQDPQGGRIINNGSISAHVPRFGSAPYTASKHGVTGLTRSISLDGRPFNIACSQIDIGNADTPLTARMATGVPQADGTIATEPTMDVDLVADAVVQMASLPLDANVQFMTIMATKMPFIGRG